MRSTALIPAIILTAAVSLAGWSPQQLSWLRVAHEDVAIDPIWVDLLAYWALEEDAATTDVFDSHATNHGTANKNTDQISTDGKIGKAFDFSGGEDSVDFGDIDLGSTISVAFWFVPDAWNAAQNEYRHIVAKGNLFSSADYEFAVIQRVNTLSTASQALSARLKSGGSSYALNIPDAYNYAPAGQWAHVAFTWETGLQKLYINGIQRENAEHAVGIPSSNIDLLIGGPNAKDSSSRFTSSPGVDEVAIWKRALTSNEVYRLYSEELTYP